MPKQGGSERVSPGTMHIQANRAGLEHSADVDTASPTPPPPAALLVAFAPAAAATIAAAAAMAAAAFVPHRLPQS